MSHFQIRGYVLGSVSTNCYIISNEETREAVIVDPADSAGFLLQKLDEFSLTLKAILLTHGHFDHIMAAEELRRKTKCKLYASREEARLLADTQWNLSAYMGDRAASLTADVSVEDGQELELIGFRWRVIATPGHTSGSVCYYVESENVLISGDTLFCQSLGRTDFPTGSVRQIVESITERLFALPDETAVYSGHGEQTTIGFEKTHNPVAFYR